MLLRQNQDNEVIKSAQDQSTEMKQRRQMEKQMKKFQKLENKQNVQDYQENFVTKNYTHINSQVEKLRFKNWAEPGLGKLPPSEKVLINRRVLNDYIHIVNKRQDVVDQMEDNFWTMVELYDGTLHYFNKYYGKNLEDKLEKLKRIIKPEHRYLLNSVDKNEIRIKRRLLEFENATKSKDPMLKKALEECSNIKEIVNKNHEAIRQRIQDRHNKMKQESHMEKLSKKKGYLVNEREVEQLRQNQLIMSEVQKFGSDRIKLQLFEQDMKSIIQNQGIQDKINKIQQSLDKINTQGGTQSKTQEQTIPELQDQEGSKNSIKDDEEGEDDEKLQSSSQIITTRIPSKAVSNKSQPFLQIGSQLGDNHDQNSSFSRRHSHTNINPFFTGEEQLRNEFDTRTQQSQVPRVQNEEQVPEKINLSFSGNHGNVENDSQVVSDKKTHRSNFFSHHFQKEKNGSQKTSASLNSLSPSYFPSEINKSSNYQPPSSAISGFRSTLQTPVLLSPPSTSYTSPNRLLVSASYQSRSSFIESTDIPIKVTKKEKVKSVVSFVLPKQPTEQSDDLHISQPKEIKSLQKMKEVLSQTTSSIYPKVEQRRQNITSKSMHDLSNRQQSQNKGEEKTKDQEGARGVSISVNQVNQKPEDINQPLKPTLKKLQMAIDAQLTDSVYTSNIESKSVNTLQSSRIQSFDAISNGNNSIGVKNYSRPYFISMTSSQSPLEGSSQSHLEGILLPQNTSHQMSHSPLRRMISFEQIPGIKSTSSGVPKMGKLKRLTTLIPSDEVELIQDFLPYSKYNKQRFESGARLSRTNIEYQDNPNAQIPILEWEQQNKTLNRDSKVGSQKKMPVQSEEELLAEEEKKNNESNAEQEKSTKKNKGKKMNFFDKKDKAKTMESSNKSTPFLKNKVGNDTDIFKYKKINQFMIEYYYDKKILNKHKDEVPMLNAKELEVIQNEKQKSALWRSLSSQSSNKHLFWNNVEKKKADFLSLEKEKDIEIGPEAEEKYEQEIQKKLGFEISNLYRDIQKDISSQMEQSKVFSKDLLIGEKELMEDHKKLKSEYSNLLGPKVYKSIYVEQILNQTKKQLNVKLHKKHLKVSSPEKILQNLLKQDKKLNAWGKTMRHQDEQKETKKYSLIANSVSSKQQTKQSKREQTLQEINKYIEKIQDSSHQKDLKEQLEHLMKLDSKRKQMFQLTTRKFISGNTVNKSKNNYLNQDLTHAEGDVPQGTEANGAQGQIQVPLQEENL